MRNARIEFDEGRTEVRFLVGDNVDTRPFDPALSEQLAEQAIDVYQLDSTLQGPTAGELAGLGRDAYDYLDSGTDWLKKLGDDGREVALHLPSESSFRVVPWELLSDHLGTPLSAKATSPWCVVRTVAGNDITSDPDREPSNRPLRVLFMASAPDEVDAPLDYEVEEQLILEATESLSEQNGSHGAREPSDDRLGQPDRPRLHLDLVVEESGSLDGLNAIRELHGSDYFDVLHLSGHAHIRDEMPVFLMEDDVGRPVLATAEDIVEAIGGEWPPLVFLSGCFTGGAPDEAIPSLCESLVRTGAPAVIGWALPVGDQAASRFAAHLYGALAAGDRLDRAVANARSKLYQLENKSGRQAYWHLVRLYSNRTELGSLVTLPTTADRLPPRHLPLDRELLAPDTKMNVASRGEFIGRRKLIQRCLTHLRSPLSEAEANEILILKGMGGLGKTTLAARLLERMNTYEPVVHIGRINLTDSPTTTTQILNKLELGDDAQKSFYEDAEELPLDQLLTGLLAGPLADRAILFLFDDFEIGNLAEGRGGALRPLTAESGELLGALSSAIRSTRHRSRIVVTCRYEFRVPDGSHAIVEALESLSDVELEKKLRKLDHLQEVNAELRAQAVAAGARNPRLLESINQLVGSNKTSDDASQRSWQLEPLIDALSREAETFRAVDIAAEELLAAQQPEVRELLARVDVVRLPIPAEAVVAIHNHSDGTTHIRNASRVGLLEEGIDPETGEHRYFVSDVLRPLLGDVLDEEQIKSACAAAARSLYEIWVSDRGDDSHRSPGADTK